ncbi:MAG TPA: TonB-dependent receptor [Acidobacteriaceae bacterium]|nr:TonB-dependent receptor [Acidobacteriaceae bacterium]
MQRTIHDFATDGGRFGAAELANGWRKTRPGTLDFLAIAQVLVMLIGLAVGGEAASWSQEATGSINGIVSDQQGAVIPGAKVSVKNIDTQVAINGITNSDGSYLVQSLNVGSYEVTIEAPGFKTIVATNIHVEATNIVKLDEQLSPGTTSSTVEVNAGGTALETEKIANSTTLEEKIVQGTPVVPATGSFRDSTLLINLTPGASGSFYGVNIAGGRAFAQEVQVDGIPQLFSPTQNTAVLVVHPSFDVISQVYTQPGVPAPEFGRSSGGAVTELTRSGTDAYHGNAAVFFRNTALDARAYNVAKVSTDHQYELPLSIGGPVRIPHLYNGVGRTFFFFNYTNYWTSIQTPEYYTIPTEAERTGDFSDQLAQGQILYNPATQVNGVRQPFPNNQITPTSAIALQAIGLLPKPTNGALVNNYFATSPNNRDENHYFIRIDHNLTRKQSIHGTYRRDTFVGYQPDGIFQANHFDTVVNIFNPWYDWIISPSLLNHFSAAATHYTNPNQANLPGSYTFPNTPLIKVPGVYPQGRFEPQQPAFNFTNGYANIFAQSYQINGNASWEYDDVLSWTKGKHNFKFGERFNAFQGDSTTPQGLAGAFNFSNQETGIGPNQTGSNTGNPIASFLLGYVDNASTQQNVATYARTKYFGIFAQDSWRVTARLTTNYGVRWEMQTPINDAEGHMTTLNPNLANAAAGGISGGLIFAGKGAGRTGSNSFLSTWKGGWGPRIGLAYELTHNTVVRAGYGIIYAPFQYTYDQSGFSLNSTAISPDSGYTPSFGLDSGFPASKLVATAVLSPTIYNGQNISLLDTRNGKSNRLQDNQIWQLDVQRTLGSFYFDVGYVGEVGHHIPGGGNPTYNQVRPGNLALGALLTEDINSPAVVAAGYTPPYPGFTGSLAQALRPFPQFLAVNPTNYPAGSSSWNGLLAKVQKRYSNGFTLLVAYTYSKEFSNVGFSQAGDNTTQDTYNPKSQKSLGDLNTPQNLQISYVYDLPFGHGRQYLNKGLVGRLVEGFGFSGLQSYESGAPIHITPDVPGLPIFNSNLFVNIVPGVKQKLASRGQVVKYNSLFDTTGTAHGTKFLNADGFASPAPYSFGNSRYFLDHLQQLAVLNENLSFYKRTSFGEGRYFETRVEMFNAFNRQNYGGLDTNLADNTPNGHFGEYTGEYSNLNFGVQPGPKITEIVLKIVF